MHRNIRVASTASAPRMVTYKFWGKSAPIIPRLGPHRDSPRNGLNRTSSESIRQIQLFHRGR